MSLDFIINGQKWIEGIIERRTCPFFTSLVYLAKLMFSTLMSALFLESCSKIWNLHVYLICIVYIFPLLKVIKKIVINMMVIMSIEHIAFIFQSWTVTIVLMLLLMCHCECANFSAFYKSKILW